MSAFKQILLNKISKSCICNILVKLSAAAELQSFKGHFTGQKLNINMDSLTVYQLTMKFD